MSFTCPECHWVSHHPQDQAEGYCGRCHAWTGATPAAERLREIQERDDRRFAGGRVVATASQAHMDVHFLLGLVRQLAGGAS